MAWPKRGEDEEEEEKEQRTHNAIAGLTLTPEEALPFLKPGLVPVVAHFGRLWMDPSLLEAPPPTHKSFGPRSHKAVCLGSTAGAPRISLLHSQPAERELPVQTYVSGEWQWG